MSSSGAGKHDTSTPVPVNDEALASHLQKQKSAVEDTIEQGKCKCISLINVTGDGKQGDLGNKLSVVCQCCC
jgi:hypothetical protein